LTFTRNNGNARKFPERVSAKFRLAADAERIGESYRRSDSVDGQQFGQVYAAV
jgi:hypothetical protein